MPNNWFNKKLFGWIHSKNLIYNTCWEDPRIDRQALQLNGNSVVATITSAGCNALDYVLAGAARVHAIDVNPKQNALLELKLAAARGLSYDEYFEWFGKGRFYNPAQAYSNILRNYLSSQAQEFWDKRIGYFSGEGWRSSFYFHGTTGFFARLVNTYIDRVLGAREIIEDVLGAPDLPGQQSIYFKTLKPLFWGKSVRWLLDRDLTLALLGVPRSQREQVERFIDGGMSAFVESCLDAIFGKLSLADNYFWRVYLKGEYTEGCCPEYLTRQGYQRIREGLWQNVSIHNSTLLDFLRKGTQRISHFVLLDHMDWLQAHDKLVLEAEWQAILDSAMPRARVIWRSGGTKVDYLDTIVVRHGRKRKWLGDVLEYHPGLARRLHEMDRVHTYGSFYISDLCPA